MTVTIEQAHDAIALLFTFVSQYNHDESHELLQQLQFNIDIMTRGNETTERKRPTFKRKTQQTETPTESVQVKSRPKVSIKKPAPEPVDINQVITDLKDRPEPLNFADVDYIVNNAETVDQLEKVRDDIIRVYESDEPFYSAVSRVLSLQDIDEWKDMERLSLLYPVIRETPKYKKMLRTELGIGAAFDILHTYRHHNKIPLSINELGAIFDVSYYSLSNSSGVSYDEVIEALDLLERYLPVGVSPQLIHTVRQQITEHIESSQVLDKTDEPVLSSKDELRQQISHHFTELLSLIEKAPNKAALDWSDMLSEMARDIDARFN